MEDIKILQRTSLRTLQDELARRGELINESNTETKSETTLGKALLNEGIRVKPNWMVKGKSFDFKLFEYPILIEVDGGIHLTKAKHLKDISKDRDAHTSGYMVLRFTNTEIDSNVAKCVAIIKTAIMIRGYSPKQVWVYPLTVWEQIKYWLNISGYKQRVQSGRFIKNDR